MNPGNSKPKSRRRWWILVSLIIVLALLVWPTLIGVGAFLVTDEVSTSDGSHLLLLDATEGDVVAAEIIQKHPDRRILILQKLPGRPMELGVLPPFDVFIRGRLEEKGVPKESIEVIPGSSVNQETQVRQLKGWMAEHPDAKVVGLSDQLSGRTWRTLLDRILSPEEAQRVKLHAVVRPKVNSSNWWKTKIGIVSVLQHYLTLCFSVEGAER